VKITDFGIAALTDMSKTKTGTILGSRSTCRRSRCRATSDGRSDLYSLA